MIDIRDQLVEKMGLLNAQQVMMGRKRLVARRKPLSKKALRPEHDTAEARYISSAFKDALYNTIGDTNARRYLNGEMQLEEIIADNHEELHRMGDVALSGANL